MRLIYWSTCPYACKVLGVLAATGLESQVERIPMHPWEADSLLPTHNPLHKVPVLITDRGITVYDSRVICEFLDSLHKGAKLFPTATKSNTDRWETLTLQALADGIMDATILKLTEENVRAQPLQSTKWERRQNRIIEKGLETLENKAAGFYQTKTDIGLISVAACLNYLSYRYGLAAWRGTHPRLSTWLSRANEDPVYSATIPLEIDPLPNNMEQLNE